MSPMKGMNGFEKNRHASVVGFALIAFILPLGQPAVAQSVAVQGGNPTLTITTGIPGGTLTPVTNVATRIRYKQADVATKITVQTSCPGQKFGLSVLATAVGDGAAAPTVTLSDGGPATDLVTNIAIGKRFFTLTLQYTASATFSQGNSTELGNDIHTVTYTMVAQ